MLAQIGLGGQSVLAGATVSLPTTATVLCLMGLAAFDGSSIDARHGAIFARTELFFPVAVTLLSFGGNRLLGPNLAGALGNATQLFAIAFSLLILGNHFSAALLRGEILHRRLLAGIALTVIGVVLLLARG